MVYNTIFDTEILTLSQQQIENSGLSQAELLASYNEQQPPAIQTWCLCEPAFQSQCVEITAGQIEGTTITLAARPGNLRPGVDPDELFSTHAYRVNEELAATCEVYNPAALTLP